jgi:uncharacterized membrane protein YdbT with pleckstrin-like domain
MKQQKSKTKTYRERLSEWWEHTAKPLLMIFVIIGGMIGLLISAIYFEFAAYRKRLPDAPAWTFFFQGNRR